MQKKLSIFLTCFLGTIAIWKSIVAYISIKEKHFNFWIEILFAIFWLVLTIGCLLTMFIKNYGLLLWLILLFSWGLIALTIFYMLYSYVIKSPDYLETPEAIEQYNNELQAEKERKERIQSKFQTKSINTLESKLKRLKDLKDQKLITEEEYREKKADLLDNSF